jgi:histidyl-tRNA synthetase
MQFDADTVGTPGVAADAEMAMMMADVMEALGIARGQYVIRVNNRKVLDGLLESAAVPFEKRLAVLRAIDKADKFPLSEVELLLGPGRWDGGKPGEGDFTPGAGLSEFGVKKILDFVFASEIIHYAPTGQDRYYVEGDELQTSNGTDWFYSNFNTITGLSAIIGDTQIGQEAVNELEQFFKIVAAAGYGSRRVRFDPSVVRGLEYYTGPVYEAELLAEIPNEEGKVVRFGSVGGGGRYDGLVSRFRGEPVPATGFSIGVSRLMTALKNLGKLDTSDVIGPVVVLVMDRDTDSLGRYQRMVADLRGAGIRAEMYLGGSGMKPQMKYADRRNAPCVVIQGGDERAKGEVTIKDMALGVVLSK